MRRLLVGDALAAARALLAVPPRRRPWVLHRMIREATRAETFRRATGRMHPIWGDGTLAAAALRRACRPEPGLDDEDFRACLIAVLIAAGRQPRAQETQVGIAGSASSRLGAISSPHSVQ